MEDKGARVKMLVLTVLTLCHCVSSRADGVFSGNPASFVGCFHGIKSLR